MVTSLQRYLRTAEAAARSAGTLLRAKIGAPMRVETKSSALDLVTEIDRASEALIHRRLMRAFPHHGFYGEESSRTNLTSPYRWIVDPLDGTTNFVHGVPMFAVSIALAYRKQILVGVVYDPMRREMFSAVQGHGLRVNGKRTRVSRTTRLAQSLLSTGFASTFHKDYAKYLHWFCHFESKSRAVRRTGSAALSLAYIAAGRLDGFYEQGLWPWDMAAGALLVREAGGRITSFRGTRANLFERGELIATNGKIHRKILAGLALRPRR